MTVKDNHPTLHADLERLFKCPAGPAHDLRWVEQTSKAHGRLETRTVWATADGKGYGDWPALAQGLCLQRRGVRLATGEIATERVCGLTNLTSDHLDRAKTLQHGRGHWAIENRLHWVKAGLLKEHASRVRTDQAPLILATLRHALVACLRAFGFDSLTQSRRHCALNVEEALAGFCGPLV